MSSWLISVPVWGADYVSTFVRCAAPALLAARSRVPELVKFVIHTDAPSRIRAALPDQLVEFRSLPNKPTYVALQESHADALASASPGDRVVLLNADLCVSGNLLESCAAHFAAGRSAVVLLGIRTTAAPQPPPAGAASRALLAWAWEHRHQIIRDLEWPHGGSMLPTNLFWTAGESTVARGFHLHPVAVVRPQQISFKSTIDGDLLDRFPRDGIHVVVDPDDCAMCEVSHPSRRFPVRGLAFTPSAVAGAMAGRASVTHRWLFEHRIVVRGRADDVVEDTAIAASILRGMGGGASPRPPVGSPAVTPRPPRPRRPAGRIGRVPR